MASQETLDNWTIRGFIGIVKFLESRPCVHVTQKSLNLLESYKLRLQEALKKFEEGEPDALESSISKRRWFMMGFDFFMGFFEQEIEHFTEQEIEFVLKQIKEFERTCQKQSRKNGSEIT